ncbi:uncharacterized protein BO88DRAFT_424805 [Aspergillus vadensis CBS 113365]|uniref:Uncharacterized protein n=1 Tax=Aspergillus vadensis (strain CBS 113365 / IMI 142717 / IBT 24658) TaxID=1448311 RepID=A0A319CNC5_ASPVC|nr:hypothetical protein BO88DRAFT_424805 [Aspergillus vadensis CBS 113365]PYH69842.1 hypothetical protein BO88DRAFT_424805 [Aspergillus vadensis CBS 113365]
MRMKERLVERCWGGASFSHMSRCFWRLSLPKTRAACSTLGEEKARLKMGMWRRKLARVASGVVLRRFLSLSHVFPCVSSQLLASVIYILRGGSRWDQPGRMCFMQHASEPVPTDSPPNRELYISQSGTMM